MAKPVNMTLPEQLFKRLRTVTEEINRIASRAQFLADRIERGTADVEDIITHDTLEIVLDRLEQLREEFRTLHGRAVEAEQAVGTHNRINGGK